VGAVIAPEHRAAVQGDPRAVWRSMIEACPEVASKLVGVPAATEAPYDQVRVRKDYSYWKQSFHVPGMVLVGDAACFVDPVLSSGVHLATYGALLAARSINACLDGAVPEERSLAEFEARYRREYGVFYEFLISFYDMHRDARSYFWQAKRVTAVDATEAAAFAELVGGLLPGETGVGIRFADAAADLDRAVGLLPTADDRRNPLYTSRTVGETFRQGRNLQEEALYGAPLDDADPPVPDGLALAEDGLGWRI